MAQVSDVAVSQSGNSNLLRGRIAGLEPINFITLATPHLGVRGKKQVLFFSTYHNWNFGIKEFHIYLAVPVRRCGVCVIKKVVSRFSHVNFIYLLLVFRQIS